MVVKLILSVISQAVTQLLRWNLIDINKLSMFNSSIQSTSQSKYLKQLILGFDNGRFIPLTIYDEN